MTRLEQRCKGVAKVLNDYNIKYLKEYDSDKYLKIIGTPFHIEITNKYIGINYKKGHYYNFLPSFESINEFRNFVELNGTNFMKLKNN